MRFQSSRSGLSIVALGALAIGACDSSTEPPRATEITFFVSSVTLDAIGATQTIVPTVRDSRGRAMSGASVSWTSNAAGIATVGADGIVLAVTNGDAIITASVGSVSAPLPVHVEQAPVAPAVVAGDAQSGTVAAPLANALQVRVVDRLGVAISGRDVAFAVTQGGGSLGTPSVVSAGDGLASTTWTLGNNTAQLQRVTVSVAGSANQTVLSATAVAGSPAALGLAPTANGDGQSVPRGTAVPVRPAVKVSDAFDNGVPGITVTFAVVSGGGSITGAVAISNASGIATVGSWTVGNALGPNTLEATSGALTPVLFTVTAIEDPCSPAGAPVIGVGQSINSEISATDCQLPAPGLQNFELYRFDVASGATFVLEMSANFDAWLSVLDFNTQAIIIENDDIIPGQIQDSRIVTPLAAGSYLLRARTFDPGQTGTFTLSTRTALVGVAAVVAAGAGDGQVVAPDAAVPVAPSVVVRDELGTPIAGVSVTFATLPGIGSASGTSAVTDVNGVATVGSWTVAAGANVLSATVNAPNVVDNPVVFSASGAASTSGFNIALRFATMPTLTQLQTFSTAAARWESIVTNDLPSQRIILDPGDCSSAISVDEVVDDLVILVRLAPIDGPGQVLGSAGPCQVRNASLLPAWGTMQFDDADLATLEGNGRLGAVILHEMGHVLGIGTLWSLKGFLQNPSLPSSPGANTHFNGPAAIAAFNTVGGSTWTGSPTANSKVPVENSQGGAGTRDSHWRESVLQNELMTGFIAAGANPLSVLTIRSLEDLGYSVNTGPADAFFVALSLRAAGSGGTPDLHLKDDIWKGEVRRVDVNGRPVDRTSKR